MGFFAIGIEYPLDMTVQRFHHATDGEVTPYSKPTRICTKTWEM
jgi:hypothetical protein